MNEYGLFSLLFRFIFLCSFPVSLSREFLDISADISKTRAYNQYGSKIQWVNFPNACFLPVNCLLNRELRPSTAGLRTRTPSKITAPPFFKAPVTGVFFVGVICSF